MDSIEETLGLDKEEIEKRMQEVEGNIPSYPGIKYLEVRLKEFEVQPWPFLSYIAHYAPREFRNILSSYKDYDGVESSGVILEKLKEEYIFYKVLEKIRDGLPENLKKDFH